MKYLVNISFLLFLAHFSNAQEHSMVIEGYVFEEGNRGYIRGAVISVVNDDKNGVLVAKTTTDMEGFFTVTVNEKPSDFKVKVEHKLFYPKSMSPDISKSDSNKSFVKVELERKPGYIFDVTLAENNTVNTERVVDAIQGAKVEIYNNTAGEESLVIDTLASPNFNFTFEQGNHYTVMVRKEGYLTKRMEAFVNVDGCILCFEGITNVTDVLTSGNERGTFLANIEMDRIAINKTFDLKNIYLSLIHI